MRVILKPGGLLALATLLVAILGGVYLIGQGKGAREAAKGGPAGGPAGASPAAGAAARTPTERGKTTGNLFQDSVWKFYTEKGAVATQTPLAGKQAPAQPAHRFDVTRVGANDWNVGFNQKLTGVTFARGEKVRLRLWARSPDKSLVTLIMQRDVDPFPHCWKDHLRPTAEWKQYTFEFQTDVYQDGEGLVNCFMGAQAGTTELAGVTLERVR